MQNPLTLTALSLSNASPSNTNTNAGNQAEFHVSFEYTRLMEEKHLDFVQKYKQGATLVNAVTGKMSSEKIA